MAESTKYVLNEGDRWFYFFGSRYGVSLRYFADGQEMEPTLQAGWWVTDHEAERIEEETPPTQRTVAYRLIPGVGPTERYPERLALEAWRERIDEDSAQHDSKVYGLYEAETKDVPAQRSVIEGPWLRLEGAPPTDDGLRWIAKLPFELQYTAEYRHLFPGRFDGFRSALVTHLEKIPGVSNVFDQSDFTVYIKQDWDQPIMVMEKRRRDRKRKPYPKSPVTHRLTLHPPRNIAGKNRAEAKASWDREIARYVAQITEIATATACSHCNGKGFLWGDERAEVQA